MSGIRIAIVGGGAAGMMAALSCKMSDESCHVTIFEKNPKLGVKVLISGGGRCNVTTSLDDINLLLKKYPRGSHFLKSAFFNMPPMGVRELFEQNGIPLKVEEDGRVFPKSDNGKDIVGFFERELAQKGVNILYNSPVSDVKHDETGFSIASVDKLPQSFDRVIITSGGNAFRSTGSTGDGYTLASNLHHKITKLAPSLNSFKLSEKFCSNLSGVTLKNAALECIVDNKKVSYKHSMMFTHTGITGPLVFALSALTAYENYDEKNPMVIELDMVPYLNQTELEQALLDNTKSSPHVSLGNTLHALNLPRSLCNELIALSGLDNQRKMNEVSYKALRDMAVTLKKLKLHVIGRGKGDEFVTAGGVDLSEISSKTMESKLTKGLYFAGEILDVDGFTGGYNLQAAWATGYLAGKYATCV